MGERDNKPAEPDGIAEAGAAFDSFILAKVTREAALLRAENAHWFYEHDGEGQLLRNEDGRILLSPAGRVFVIRLGQLESDPLLQAAPPRVLFRVAMVEVRKRFGSSVSGRRPAA